MLEVGMKAPEFTLPNQNGEMVSLSDFLGKRVVIYFYPRDNTPGCTKQAVAFGTLVERFAQHNSVILGISKDSVKSHLKFTEKYELPFTLLSDTELIALQSYEVWQEKKLYGKVSMGVVRSTFVVDEQGNLAHIARKVKAAENADDTLACVIGG